MARDKFFRCEVCGKFVSHKDFDNGKIKYFYDCPDSPFEPSGIAHKKCLKEDHDACDTTQSYR